MGEHQLISTVTHFVDENIIVRTGFLPRFNNFRVLALPSCLLTVRNIVRTFTLESWYRFIHHLDEFVVEKNNEYRDDDISITSYEAEKLLKIEHAVHVRLDKLFSRRAQVGLELTELIRRLVVAYKNFYTRNINNDEGVLCFVRENLDKCLVNVVRSRIIKKEIGTSFFMERICTVLRNIKQSSPHY